MSWEWPYNQQFLISELQKQNKLNFKCQFEFEIIQTHGTIITHNTQTYIFFLSFFFFLVIFVCFPAKSQLYDTQKNTKYN